MVKPISDDKSSEKTSYHTHYHPNKFDQELQYESGIAAWISKFDDDVLKPFLIYKYDRTQKMKLDKEVEFARLFNRSGEKIEEQFK